MQLLQPQVIVNLILGTAESRLLFQVFLPLRLKVHFPDKLSFRFRQLLYFFSLIFKTLFIFPSLNFN